MKLKRIRLYEMVWGKPMTRLASEFGLSDVGLAKICRKHGIPLPERGYWARVEAGYKVPKKVLTRKDYDPDIEIMDRDPITEAVLKQKKEKKEKQAEAVANIGTLRVPTKLTSPHRLTSMTFEFFEDIKKKIERESRMKDRYQLDWRERAPIPDNGRYQCRPENGFNLRVSIEGLHRA